MKTFIFLLFLFFMLAAMKMGDMFGLLIAMAGFLFMWALMDDEDIDA
jgi:hypothetical protein